jgi:hypothetical protein
MKAPAGDLPDRTGQSEMFTAEIGKAPYEIHEAKLLLYWAASQKGGSRVSLAQQGGKLLMSSIVRTSRKLYLMFH